MRTTLVAIAAVSLFCVPPAAAQAPEPGPLEKAARPITPENPIPRRLTSPLPDYPAALTGSEAKATITCRVTIDAAGHVAELRPTNVSVSALVPKFDLTIRNPRPDDAKKLLALQLNQSDTATAVDIVDTFVTTAAEAVRRWTYEPPADPPISFLIAMGFASGTPTSTTQSVPLSAAPPGEPWTPPEGAVRIGGNVKPPQKIRDVRPAYPPEALAGRVQGMVIIEALIGTDGTVKNAHVVRSVPLLDQAALDAVMQWQFTPTLVDGKPVPVVMTVTVNFALQPRK